MNPTTLTSHASFGVLATATLPVTALARVLDDPAAPRRAGRTLRRLARAVVATTRAWKVTVEGAPPADLDQRPCVVVANHASLADPFVLAHLPFDMRFVAKEELFRTPLVGWLLRLGGDIPIRRGDAASAVQMTARCVRTLHHGLSVMIFPEGTRSHDGALGRFRDGAFHVAAAAGARVLPVALHGTGACLARGDVRRARTRVEILAPIEPAGLSVAALRDQARDAIASALARDAAADVVGDYFLGCPMLVSPDDAGRVAPTTPAVVPRTTRRRGDSARPTAA